MNVENILRLASVIEQAKPVTSIVVEDRYSGISAPDRPPTEFCMNFWHCGTAACVGGWASAIFPQSEWDGNPLGISDNQRLRLHLMYGCEIPLDDERLTPAVAAATLRHLAATGEVDWRLHVEAADRPA